MSTSRAPRSMASDTSAASSSLVRPPVGKAATVQGAVADEPRISTQSSRGNGSTTPAAHPSETASSHTAATSSGVAPGRRMVASMRAARSRRSTGSGLRQADAEVADEGLAVLFDDVEGHPLAGSEESEHALVHGDRVDGPRGGPVIGDDGPRPGVDVVLLDGPLRHTGLQQHRRQYPKRSSRASRRGQLGSTFTRRSRNTRLPSSSSTSGRARTPISFSILPPLPITIPFWESRST